MNKIITLFLIGICMACQFSSESNSLWEHVSADELLTGSKGVKAEFIIESSIQSLLITNIEYNKYNWSTIKAPEGGWHLEQALYVSASFTNTGDSEVELLFWIHANKGWDAVASKAVLKPGESRNLKCNLRETFPDGTPKIDPSCIDKIQFMLVKPKPGARLLISNLKNEGLAEKWYAPEARLTVPDMETGKLETGNQETGDRGVEAGKRKKIFITEYKDKYGVLYLPKDWKPEKQYPLIVEFPGNIFYTTGCYSTGRPEHCTMGYGMSKGENAIWLSLPFVDYNKPDIAESGWGNPEHTADFAYKMVKYVCNEFNADESKVILTGFSRGAIACGFIGLRNDSIASLWKGIHACQHFDGDGWGKAKMDEAIVRLQRGKHIPQFHTDNNKEQPKLMFEENDIDVVYEDSGLGAHACAMFLDDRESTTKLREWFYNLTTYK